LLKPGEITADDVRRDLGKPSHELVDGTLLVYSWSHPSQSYMTWAFQSSTICGGKEQRSSSDIYASTSGTIHHLLIRFDADGVLRETRLRKGGYVSSDATGIADAVKFAID
jgi:hypothetical protein